MFRKSVLLVIAAASLFVTASPVRATVVPFEIFNSPTFAADPQFSFSVEALDGGTNTVDFIFRNTSTMNSTIARVYFDGDFLSGIAKITNGIGTQFVADSTPSNLPGGSIIDFVADFSSGAIPSPAQNGIDPGESLTVKANLSGSHTLAEILGQLGTADLRIGAHIISAGPDQVSFSAVTVAQPTTPEPTPPDVPEPASALLLGIGAVLFRLRRR